ncbi:MAG: alkaline phosphatase family protein [Deltaproteobacteria bacterium]|nr:alkaline phosphatase family protein [Deltaproteobacteria bacterium]
MLLVGLDGADWAIIDPLLEAGKLPALAGLLARGGRAVLESTRPPVTFPAWASFFTGLPPSEHGVLDFMRWQPGGYAPRFHSGRPRVRTVLEEAAEAGARVCALGFPGTYPPPRLPGGFLLAGFDAPVALRAPADAAWPAARHAALRRALGPWPFAEIDELSVGPGWHERALLALERGLRTKLRYAEVLLAEEPWDLFAIHLGETDTVGHHFLAFADPHAPRRPARVTPREAEAVERIHRQADAGLARMLALSGEGTSVILVSDHGMESSSDEVFHPNRALAAGGFTALRSPPRGAAGLGRRGREALQAAALRHLPGRLKEQLFRSLGRHTDWPSRLETGRRLGAVEISRSAAFSESLTYAPSVRFNLRGREPLGTVRPEDAEVLERAISAHLLGLRHPETGEPLVEAVLPRRELHRGRAAEEAPDLTLELGRHRGYRLTALGAAGPGPVVSRLSGAARLGGKGRAPLGVHRREGILALAGPAFEARLASLPAALPIADGAGLLREALGLVAAPPRPVSETPYTPEQAARVRERLAAMGYFE